MLRAFDPLDETVDVVEVEARPKSQIPWDHPKSLQLGGPSVEPATQGLVHDRLERLAASPGLRCQPGHHVVFDRHGRPLAHIMKYRDEAS